MAKKPKPRAARPLPEYPDSYPSVFQKGTLGYVLDQEAGVEKTTAARKQILASELPPSDFSNAMHKIGRPVGTDYRSAPEWTIWLAGRRFESRKTRESIEDMEEEIANLERQIDFYEGNPTE